MGITGIIMASGFSRRMGENKLLMMHNKKPIISYILENVFKAVLDERIIVTNNNDIQKIAESLDFNVVINNEAHLGQSNSIKLGIENANKQNAYMFFVGDQPFLTAQTINKIIIFYKGNTNKIVLPVVSDKRCNPVIFPNSLKDELLTLKGDTGGKDIINKNPNLVMNLRLNYENEFFDIDTTEDYKKMRNEIE